MNVQSEGHYQDPIYVCVCVFHPHVQFYGGLGVPFKNKINCQCVNLKNINKYLLFKLTDKLTFLECNNYYF